MLRCRRARVHAHDPEKACPGLDPGWEPVFGQDHAQVKSDRAKRRGLGGGAMIPNSWAGFDFGLGSDVDMLRKSVSDFAQDRIAPRAEAIDRDNEFPRD